jgi:hypothetical protein
MNDFGLIVVVGIVVTGVVCMVDIIYGEPNPNTDPVNVLDTSLRNLYDQLGNSADVQEHAHLLTEIAKVNNALIDIASKR